MLVNNAGVVQGKALLDLSPEDIQQCVSMISRAVPHADVFQDVLREHACTLLDTEGFPSRDDQTKEGAHCKCRVLFHTTENSGVLVDTSHRSTSHPFLAWSAWRV